MTEKPRKDATLSYAPAGPSRRRQRIYRVLLAVIAVGVCGFAAWMILPEASRRLTMLNAQQRLMNSQSSRLDVYTFVAGGKVSTLGTDINFAHFREACESPLPLGNCTIYAHSIADRHGNELLVTAQVPFGASNDSPSLSVDVLKPGTLFSYPSPAQVIVRPFQFENHVDGDPTVPSSFKIFTGQPDPVDASHFTIDYELNGLRHTLDGYLDDQDVLKIEKRKEPATQPLPSSSGQSR